MEIRERKLPRHPTVLVTGGTGFIGSHTVVELLESGYRVVIVDNFYNSHPEVLDAIRTITKKSPSFVKGDVSSRRLMDRVFRDYPIDAVIHFAGYKAVGESWEKPLKYYRNNLDTTLTLLEAMKKAGCEVLVFSSSATVYAAGDMKAMTEDFPLGTSNPYGTTKLMIEKILNDLSASDPAWSFLKLRYFNPVGAHPSGLLGEEARGVPNNLMPYLVKVATGRLECLRIFGDDYPTPDGTGIRDYVHVVDLAKAHLSALQYAFRHAGCDAVNIGTGKGTSVLELVHAFEKANGLKIPCQIVGRRAGDLAGYWADTHYAEKLLGFHAERTIEDMCRDSYRYEVQHEQAQEKRRRKP